MIILVIEIINYKAVSKYFYNVKKPFNPYFINFKIKKSIQYRFKHIMN